MATTQQSALISYIDPNMLKAHPKNVSIYGEDGYHDLVDSVRELGVMQAIYCLKNNTVISGHRRWKAALEAELKVVPVIYVQYGDELDERRAIIEFNRYRIKNGLQLHNEIVELEDIREETKKRQQATQLNGRNANNEPIFKSNSVPQTFGEPNIKTTTSYNHGGYDSLNKIDKNPNKHEREASNIVAETIGLGSGEQLRKLEYVAEHKPDLLSKINGKQGKSINSAYVSARREVVKEEVKTAEIPTGIYRVIYADPPWRYGNTQPDYHEVQDDHYPTMTVKEICDLEIGDRKVAEIALDDAVLFLWVTSPILEESFEVIKAWGFKYKASFVWDKVKHNMGHYNSVRHEFLLICVRGSCQPDENQLFDSVQSIERTEHSAKPEEFRNIIQTLYPYGTRIELFARKKTAGWEVFGNDIH